MLLRHKGELERNMWFHERAVTLPCIGSGMRSIKERRILKVWFEQMSKIVPFIFNLISGLSLSFYWNEIHCFPLSWLSMILKRTRILSGKDPQKGVQWPQVVFTGSWWPFSPMVRTHRGTDFHRGDGNVRFMLTRCFPALTQMQQGEWESHSDSMFGKTRWQLKPNHSISWKLSKRMGIEQKCAWKNTKRRYQSCRLKT